jgi:hypothetical protein
MQLRPGKDQLVSNPAAFSVVHAQFVNLGAFYVLYIHRSLF